MQTFQDTFETRKRSFISDFSICMTVPLSMYDLLVENRHQSKEEKNTCEINSTIVFQ